MDGLSHHSVNHARGRWLLAAIMLVATTAGAQPADTIAVFKVTYVSSGLVYIDGGRSDGLTVEDSAQVRHGDRVTAELAVAHLSSSSASCRVLKEDGPIKIGDSVFAHVAMASAATIASLAPVPPSATVRPGLTRDTNLPSRRPPQQVHGSVSLRSDHWSDDGSANLDYTQSTVGINVRADGLLGRDISARIRTSSRHNQRQRAYATGASETSWVGSIYELSLIYESRRVPFSVSLGRVIPRRINGIGRLDGLILEHRSGGGLYLGAFGGAEPQWQYAATRDKVSKYGAYAGFERGTHQATHYEFTLGFVTEYHGSTVSRDILCSRGLVSVGRRWTFNHAIELDVNRDWRYETAGERIGLSSLYVTSQYRIMPQLTATVSYDNRKNHWTYQTKSIADSLFDDRLRQGLRTRWQVSLPAGVDLFAGLGYSKREGETGGTHSYSADLRKYGLITQRTSLSVSAARFSGPTEHGHNIAVRFDEQLWTRTIAGLGYNLYGYNGSFDNTWRVNHRFTLSVRADIARSVFADAQYELNAGDDTDGHRINGGLGYRF